jgi:hypothetical protein
MPAITFSHADTQAAALRRTIPNFMRYHKLDLNLLTALKALLAEKNVTRR